MRITAQGIIALNAENSGFRFKLNMAYQDLIGIIAFAGIKDGSIAALKGPIFEALIQSMEYDYVR